MTDDARKGMTIATLILMASTLGSRVLGLVRDALLAARLGTGVEADAYATAFSLPDLVNTILAGGFLSLSFMPLYARIQRERGDAAAGRFLGGTTLGLFLVGSIVVVVMSWWAPVALALLQPGQVGTESMAKAIHLTRILLPAQIVFLLAGTWTGAQNFRKKFLFPALAPLVYNCGIIGGGWFLAKELGAEGFVWGALGGAIVGHFALQVIGLRWAGVGMAFPVRETLLDLRAFLWRSAPLMLGLTLGFSSELLLKRFSGYLGTGAIAQATYAFRLTMVLVALFGQSAGVASYPYLVELAGTSQWDRFQSLIGDTLRRLATFLIPATVLSCFFAPELVRLAFERGRFDSQSTLSVAFHFRVMAWAIFPWCVQIVLARGLYARGRFWFGAGLGTGCVLVSWPLWAFLVERFGVAGVGPGLLLLVGLQAVVFAVAWWNGPEGRRALAGVSSHVLETLVVSLILGGLARWATRDW
ncbi:MAG TPA: lipid II flippase MurJ, partial [Fibrobacteria bacterium]|nr:lipid II flippase MurJ [Fibrobacteria bacterium]